jgi:hypothetical protein
MFVEDKSSGETPVDDIGRLILQAAELIERKGWCQFKTSNALGEHCLVGAVCALNYQYDAAFARIGRFALANGIWTEETGFGKWNDDPSRTKQDVVNLLRAAAYGN